ncbi:asparagine synthase (glutamine-hydrolyzing) [Streptomyces cinereoruber]|uniref:asparagine synthase (glutamine-hydrolyzing) n=1 Tax=Streptomyces cinereoruber TaxID=67260 RepID=UPI003C2AF69A
MCGITGWTSYDRVPGTPPVEAVAAMTRTMACRGPDDAGLWSAPHAVLGHRRLAVIDPDAGQQPMTVEENGRTLLALTYSGEVYNHRQLRTKLRGRGHHFRTRSDTEVVLRAYLEWGPSFATRLDGMYALALWDARTRELLLVRDRLGIKPLYYCRGGGGLLFASEPKGLLAHPDVEAVVDQDGLRELLGLTKTPGHAVYAGMHEVRPGHLIRVRDSGVREERYWALEAVEHTDDLPTTVARVRSLLSDAVERQTVADVPWGTLLSGGLDSSVVTALAVRSSTAGPLHSFHVTFEGHDRDFRPDHERADADVPFARLMADHCGTEHQEIVLPAGALSADAHLDAVVRARDLPMGLGDGDASLYLLFRAIRRQATVVLSGEGSDELFGGYWWFHDPQVVAAEWFPWLAALRVATPPGVPPREALLNPGLLKQLDLDTYRRDRYSDAVREAPRLAGEDPQERRMREMVHLHLTRSVPFLLDRKDRLSMAVGLEVRVPFCDHRLVEYVFNVPWSMKTSDGREKSLLRSAVRHLLPDTVADRVKSPYPLVQDPAYAEENRRKLTALLDRTDPAPRALIDPAAARLVLESHGNPEATRRAVELALSLHSWLRQYPVRLDL